MGLQEQGQALAVPERGVPVGSVEYRVQGQDHVDEAHRVQAREHEAGKARRRSLGDF